MSTDRYITKQEALGFIRGQKPSYARTCIERVVHDFGDEEAVVIGYKIGNSDYFGESLVVDVFSVNILTQQTHHIFWTYTVPNKDTRPKARTKLSEFALTSAKKDKARWVRSRLYDSIRLLKADAESLARFRAVHNRSERHPLNAEAYTA